MVGEFPFNFLVIWLLSIIVLDKWRQVWTRFFVTMALPFAVTTRNIMAKPLTVKAIENLKPSADRREMPDGEVRGLYLQIFPSGKASWAFRYRFGRRTRKLTIGPSPEIGLKDARDLARKAHLAVSGGAGPSGREAGIQDHRTNPG